MTWIPFHRSPLIWSISVLHVCELTHIQIQWLWGPSTLRGRGNDPDSFLLVSAGYTAAIVSIRLCFEAHNGVESACRETQGTDEKMNVYHQRFNLRSPYDEKRWRVSHFGWTLGYYHIKLISRSVKLTQVRAECRLAAAAILNGSASKSSGITF